MNSGRRLRRSWLHLLGVYSTCLYSIGSSAACQQSASRLKCENCETQRKRGEQESSRGHKFSIFENFLPIRDFTSSPLVSFRSALVGACLPQTLLGTSTANWNCLLLHLRRNKQHDCHKNIQTIQ